MSLNPNRPFSDKIKHRYREIDALRGIAAFTVMLFHFTGNFQKEYGFAHPMPVTIWFGSFGVDLFFIISHFYDSRKNQNTW
jgi:peptidoglycan/LPS O-acetylase OafA/YrhL